MGSVSMNYVSKFRIYSRKALDSVSCWEVDVPSATSPPIRIGLRIRRWVPCAFVFVFDVNEASWPCSTYLLKLLSCFVDVSWASLMKKRIG